MPTTSTCVQVGLLSSQQRQCKIDPAASEADARDNRIRTFCKGMLFRQALRGRKPTYGDRELFPMPRFPCRKYISCSLNNASFSIGSCRLGTVFSQTARKCVPKHLVKACHGDKDF